MNIERAPKFVTREAIYCRLGGGSTASSVFIIMCWKLRDYVAEVRRRMEDIKHNVHFPRRVERSAVNVRLQILHESVLQRSDNFCNRVTRVKPPVFR